MEVSASPALAPNESALYDEQYFRNCLGPVPYTRDEPQWPQIFGRIAEELIRAEHPARVLDVGCALGFLVEAFWDRGVEAWGIDISDYAIANVRRDMQPYCRVASAADGIEGRYSLITCIEVLEHMHPEQALEAIRHMTAAADSILFSSTPYDVEEATHYNVRPILSWLRLFQDFGFSPDLAFDARFVASHAMMLRRRETPYTEEVLRVYAEVLRWRHEADLRDHEIGRLRDQANAAAAQAALVEPLQNELASARREIAEAVEMQDQIRAELEASLARPGKVSGVSFADGEVAAAIAAQSASQSAATRALEQRIVSLEAQLGNVALATQDVVNSRIWRTLVRGGGLLEKLLGR